MFKRSRIRRTLLISSEKIEHTNSLYRFIRAEGFIPRRLRRGMLIADAVNKKDSTLSEEEAVQKMRELSLGTVWENVKNDSW